MADDWQKLEKAFEHYFALSGETRAAYLVELEQEDPDLFIELQKLLEADDQAAEDSFFDPTKLHAANLTDEKLVGTQIGTFTLTQLLGEGGMGAVYLAEQTKPFKRRVAIKIIRVNNTNDRLQRRFEIEIQTLARLNHPNIATVHFAGTTDKGLPYFAMDYVEGLPLDDYCRQKNLSINHRFQLFTAICRAVHFAHQRGVIHRDLKPANILITEIDGQPQPKIIDFGIAKAVQSDDQLEHSFQVTATQLTIPGMAVGTLGYMSPEQTLIQDRDIDLRADVYALGVILYEMLVGNLPLSRESMDSMSWDQVFKAIREEQPKIPSKAIAEPNASLSAEINIAAPSLAKKYRGEIDWIVMKALEKEPPRRYESALAFAEDCERHLTGLPVQAGPPSVRYQISRFVRRNRLLTAAVSSIFLALVLAVAGFATAYFQSKEAEQKIQKEVETARTTIKLLEDFITAVAPRNQGTNAKLIDQLYEFSPKIEGMALSNEIKGNLHQMVGKAYRMVADYENSEKHLKKAVAIRKGVFEPGALPIFESEYELCLTLFNVTDSYDMRPYYLNILENYTPTSQNSDKYINIILLMGESFSIARQNSQAMAYCNKAEEAMKRNPPDNQYNKLKLRNIRAATYQNQGDLKKAETLLRESLSLNNLKGRNVALSIHAKLLLSDIYEIKNDFRTAKEIWDNAYSQAIAYYGSNHNKIINMDILETYTMLRDGRYHQILNTATRLHNHFRASNTSKNIQLYNLIKSARLASLMTAQDNIFLSLMDNYFLQNVVPEANTHLTAQQYGLLSSVLIRLKHYQEALSISLSAYYLEELKGHPSEEFSAELANQLCTIFTKLKDYNTASRWGCVAFSFAENVFGIKHELTLTYAYRWVFALVESDYPEGEVELNMVISESKALWGPDNLHAKQLSDFRNESQERFRQKSAKN